MSQRLHNVLALYERRAAAILIAGFLFTVLSVVLATRLRLESEFERMLPTTAPAVQNLRKLERVYGQQLDRITFLLEGPDGAKNEAAALAIGEALKGAPRVLHVEVTKPTEFFEQRRLLYMEREDAATIHDRISKRLKWERRRANPLFVPLGDEEPPSVAFPEIEAKYKKRFGDDRFVANADHTKLLVTAQLDFPSDEMKTTEALLPGWRATVEQAVKPFEGVQVSYTGRYVKRLEQRDATAADLGKGTLVAFGLILLFLLLYFRSFLLPAVVSAPLIAGTLWTFGAAWLIFDTLNILTGFLGSVLLGLGIDYGIHLASRYQEARAEHDVREALAATASSAGRASLYAGLTTLAALGSLVLSSFRAFFEFGILSLLGLIFVCIAYATLLPCLIIVLSRTRFDIKPKLSEIRPHRAWTRGELAKLRGAGVAFVVGAGAIAAFGLGHLGFQYDFYELMPEDLPSLKAQERMETFTKAARVPGVVLVDDRAHAEAVTAAIARRKAEAEAAAKATGEPVMIDRTLTIFDLMPREQAEKLEIWKALRAQFDKIPERSIKKDPKLKDFRDEVVRITDGGAITTAQLPDYIKDRFARVDDPAKTVVLVFPAKPLHDVREALEFIKLVDDLPAASGQGTIDTITEEHLLRDIFADLRRDTPRMLFATLISIFAVASLAFREPKRIALVMLTILVGFTLGMGLVGASGTLFNFINMIVLPIWLGLGVDAAFHIMTRRAEDPTDVWGMIHTVGAVFAAFATTMIGFGCMMISHHRGLASLGHVALLGLGCIFFASVAIHSFTLRSGDDASAPDEAT